MNDELVMLKDECLLVVEGKIFKIELGFKLSPAFLIYFLCFPNLLTL